MEITIEGNADRIIQILQEHKDDIEEQRWNLLETLAYLDPKQILGRIFQEPKFKKPSNPKIYNLDLAEGKEAYVTRIYDMLHKIIDEDRNPPLYFNRIGGTMDEIRALMSIVDLLKQK